MARDQALLERESELAAIGAALRAAAAREGGAVAIEGKAGLGKTKLLAETRGLAADAGAETLAGRASELERDFPFAVVRQLLQPRLRSLPTAERESLFEGAEAAGGALGFDAGNGRSPDTFSVLHALYWVLAGLAERSPLLLAIDDAHLADAASLDWLAFMLPRLQELPILMVLARRTDEPESPGLARVLADPSLETLAPAPLSAAATARLIEETLEQEPDPSFAAVCHEITGGNPFLVTELGRELAAQGIEPRAELSEAARVLAPERVAQMVLARISRLPPGAGALASAVAVLGEETEPMLAAELAGVDQEAGREAADSLRAAAILDPGEALLFVHPLVRNAVYADLAAGERGKAHAIAAALLRERGAPPKEVATQLLASEARGDPTVVETLLEAGRRSLADGAPRSAISYLTRALREPPPPDLRIEVLKMLLTAGIRAVDPEALKLVEPELREAIERDPAATREIAIQLPIGMTLSGRFEEAAGILDASVRAAADEGDVESAFKLESQLRTIGILLPSAPKVDLQRYMGEIEPESPAGRLAAAIEARAAVMNLSRRDAINAAKRALANDGSLFEEEPEMISATTSVLVLLAADEMDTAREAAERALEIARERNSTHEIGRGWLLRGYINWGYGDLVAAEGDMRQARELARLAGIAPLGPMSMGPLALILLERDELEAVDAILEEAGIATGSSPPSALFTILLLVRGLLHFARAEFAQAAEDLVTLGDQSESLGLGPGAALIGSVYAVRALVALDRNEEAREMAEFSLYHAQRWEAPATVSHLLRAVAAAAGGAREIELLEEAAAMTTGSPRRLQHAHALFDLGAARRRQNQRGAARDPLREGLKLARQCGAVRLAKLAHEELQATGETVRRYAPIGVESLTPSERRVAEMAATGMTNRQVAQSLFVTVKTVEAHLSAAYDKLDISSRRELGAALSSSNSD